MSEYKKIQKQARSNDVMRSIFATHAPLKAQEDLYKLICINSEIASIREKVSEAPQGLTRLQFWLMQLERIYNKESLQTPEAIWLGELVSQYNLSLSDLQKWILARQKEYEPMPIGNLEDWWRHMENTGGLMAQLWLQIIMNNAPKEQWLQVQKVGAIWASVGCLRAIAFHSYIRLNLLPKELLYQNGLILPDGWRATSKDDLSPIVKKIAETTNQHIIDAQQHKYAKSLKLHLFASQKLIKYFESHSYNPFNPNWETIPKKLYWQIFLETLSY